MTNIKLLSLCFAELTFPSPPPPPPPSTLFPYTTLFRSPLGRMVPTLYRGAAEDRPPGRGLRRAWPFRGGHRGKAERKSTRLNSSHQIISYAVFCLKKKKDF